MSKTVNKLYKHNTIIYKVILFLITVFAIVYLFPKGGQFKYEFTGIINDKLNYVSKMKFVKIMDSRDLNIVAQLTTFISKLMKPYVSQKEDTRKHNIMPGITLGRCYLSQQKKKCKNRQFCRGDRRSRNARRARSSPSGHH